MSAEPSARDSIEAMQLAAIAGIIATVTVFAIVPLLPVLLEPIVSVEITAPSSSFGDISADLSTRRGHIHGMEAQPGSLQTIQAVVPLAEMLSYASTLKSMTSGQGSFTMDVEVTRP